MAKKTTSNLLKESRGGDETKNTLRHAKTVQTAREGYHSEDEKKLFRNPDRDEECYFKSSCKYGSSKCRYAHSNKMGYCIKCHKWGHLPTKCQTKPAKIKIT